ncbi:MAG: serine/threonine-protein kinase [Polyangiaceae bacterium]
MTVKPPSSDPSKGQRGSVDPIGATMVGGDVVSPNSMALGETAVGAPPAAPKPFRGPSSLKATMVSGAVSGTVGYGPSTPAPVSGTMGYERASGVNPIAATAVPSMRTGPDAFGQTVTSGGAPPASTTSATTTSSDVTGRSTTGSGAMSQRAPMSLSLPANAPMDVTVADVTAISVLPEIQMHATHAEIVSKVRPRYSMVKALGEGGVGAVELVYDNDIARRVALKRLKNDTRTPANLARFIEEIQAVGSLEHPGIAPIHDVGLDENGYFFTMKFVEGDTIEKIIDALRENQPAYLQRFSIDARVGVFMQILKTMNFAHVQGFIHRDIKPANVIVGRYGEVMVMDWGLAKQTRKDNAPTMSPEALAAMSAQPVAVEDAPRSRAFETRTGTLLGSPGYMSPEQARGLNDQLDARSDVYSLSVLFFELLSLRFYLDHHQNVTDVLRAIVSEEPVSAIGMHHRYGIPPEYTFYIRKGLEKDPAKRFQSVQEMIDALQQILDGAVPVQCPCTGLKRAGGAYGGFIDRHPIGGITAAVLVGGLSLYGGAQLVINLLRLLLSTTCTRGEKRSTRSPSIKARFARRVLLCEASSRWVCPREREASSLAASSRSQG